MLIDDAAGDRASDVIYDDLDAAHLESSIPDTAFHRNVDLALIQADKEGKSLLRAPLTKLLSSPPLLKATLGHTLPPQASSMA